MLKFFHISLPKVSSRNQLHPSWAFYACVAGAVAGTALAFAVEPLFSAPTFLAIATALLFMAIFRTTCVTVILAFFAGIVFASCRIAPEVTDAKQIATLAGQPLTISGTISSEPSATSSGIAVALTNLEIQGVTLCGTLYVQLAKSDTSANLLRSDRLTLKGKLGDAFGTYAGTMFRPEIVAVARSDPGDLAIKFKNFFADKVREYIPSPAVDLGLGYLVGDKTGLSEDFSAALRAVGMTHVVVASGAHLGILVGLVKKLFGKISKFAGLLFSLLIIFAFVLVVGFTASMTRAALVASLSLLFGYVGRQFTPLRLILFVAALTLLLSPTNLLNLGWQLSFASFFGILVVAPRLTKFLYGGKKPPWLASMLVTSLSTSLICTPLLIFSFGTFSLLSFVANLIILPTLPYAMLLVFLSGATSSLSFLAMPISTLATLLLNFHITVINFLSTKTALIFELPAGDPRIFLIYLPIIFCLAINPLRKFIRRHHKAHKPPEPIAETIKICYNDSHELPP